MTKQELIDQLSKLGVDFKKSASKAELELLLAKSRHPSRVNKRRRPEVKYIRNRG